MGCVDANKNNHHVTMSFYMMLFIVKCSYEKQFENYLTVFINGIFYESLVRIQSVLHGFFLHLKIFQKLFNCRNGMWFILQNLPKSNCFETLKISLSYFFMFEISIICKVL